MRAERWWSSNCLAPAALLVAVASVACGGGAAGDDADGTAWRGSITTEGNVTTVRNEGGSLWGGDATLVEELSIGVDVGEDAYMFGYLSGIWATDDHIYVADHRVPAVRVYDAEGLHLMDIGGEGQGPGEFQMPNSVVVGTDGRLWVKDSAMGGRVNVYEPDGTPIETLVGDTNLSSALPLVATRDGGVFTDAIERPPDGGDGYTELMGQPGRDGFVGEMVEIPTLGWEPPRIEVGNRARLAVPFAPRRSWAMSPSGAIVVGVTSEYRFEMRFPDGRVTVVEKAVELLPVDPEEAEWQRKSTILSGRNLVADWSWDGTEMPDTKPPWTSLEVDADGRVWVRRSVPSVRIDDCDPDPFAVEGRARTCWTSPLVYDVCGEDGRFLGSVELPDEVTSISAAYISGTTLVLPAEDEAGTLMVKRYRLVLPGEE